MAETALGFPAWAQMSPARRAHAERVVALLERWAEQMGTTDTERHRWLHAAYLHDALKDAPPEELASLIGTTDLAPKLWHGPAAAARALAEGETDRGVLDAVRYHSLGWAGWDDVGRLLYLADYLEPGRRHHDADRAALIERVPEAPGDALRAVVAARMGWALTSHWSVAPETVELWNALAA